MCPVRVRSGLVAVVAVSAVVSLNLSAPANTATAVEVGGRPVPIVGPSPTAGDAIASANVTLTPGALRAAVSGRVLVPDANPAVITVNGHPVGLDTPVHRNDRVEVTPGTDSVEPVDERRVVGTAPGLPRVETSLWNPGRPRVDTQTVGRVSGEVVSTALTETGVAARPETGKVVALTFDDGPDPKFTPAVMAILAEEGVKATFCVLGSAARRHPDMARAQIAAGHARCNHTVDHAHLPRLSPEGLTKQINGASDILTELDGAPPTIFRPPYGELSPQAIAAAQRAGMRVLTWNVDSDDYRKLAADKLLAKVMSAVKPGGVILLHDGGGDRTETVAALRPLIRALKAQGYTFATPTPAP